jgi:hypothetical protein
MTLEEHLACPFSGVKTLKAAPNQLAELGEVC